MIRRNVEAHAPIHARHLAAGFGREPANARLQQDPPPRARREAARVGVSLSLSRPCGLARAGTSPAARRRAARNGIAAGAKRDGAGRYSVAPSALPRDPPEAVRRRCASHRCRVLARKAIRSGPMARPCGPPRRPRDCAPPPRSSRSPRPVGPHLARPCALGGAPPLCVGIRSGREGVVATLRRRRCVPPVGPGRPVPRPARARVLARALADSSVACGARAPRMFNACTGPRLFLQM